MAPPTAESGRISSEFVLTRPEDFSIFFNEAHVQVYRFIFGLHGGPQEEVDDLTAETFLKAWNARQNFRGNQQAALSWVLRIARNLVYDSFRKKKRQADPLDIGALEISAPGCSPEESILNEENIRQLSEALQRLSPEHREMVVLRYILGWRVKDIAQHLGIAENTVSVTIKRTLTRLRSNWESPQRSQE